MNHLSLENPVSVQLTIITSTKSNRKKLRKNLFDWLKIIIN